MRTVSVFGGINNGVFPSREDIESLCVGELAPDYAGRMREIVSIHGRGDDVKGRAFVCYYVKHGDNGGAVSNSLRENTLHRTISFTRVAMSAEIDAVEEQFRREME